MGVHEVEASKSLAVALATSEQFALWMMSWPAILLAMRKIFNNRAKTPKRQQLRSEMPVAERLGWKQLRNEALGTKFRRQVSVGKYVVELGCPSLHLAIEVDGDFARERSRARI